MTRHSYSKPWTADELVQRNLVSTYSIVAFDQDSGQLGVAVQSHFFAVGALVPWAEPGVGAVASQAISNPSYGPLGLKKMRAGIGANQALTGLLEMDPAKAIRQVAMVDPQGGVAVHTGDRCIPMAGHHPGETFCVQANLMERDTVWGAMADAYLGAEGELAERMMVTLEAAQSEGGDIRGKQSAALLVVEGDRDLNPWEGRVYDLRIDDHPEPLIELRRLLDVARYYRHGRAAVAVLRDAALGDSRFKEAEEAIDRARKFMPEDNPEMLAHCAEAYVVAGKVDAALSLYEEVFKVMPAWRDLIPRLVEVGFLPDDQELVERIRSQV